MFGIFVRLLMVAVIIGVFFLGAWLDGVIHVDGTWLLGLFALLFIIFFVFGDGLGEDQEGK